MKNLIKPTRLVVAVASALALAGCVNGTSTTEATSDAGHELRTSSASQYQNVQFDERYNDGVLFEHESNLF